MNAKYIILLIAIVCLVIPVMANGNSSCYAVADNLISNCGFETGNFNGWELYNSSVAYTSTTISSFSHTGSYSAQLYSRSDTWSKSAIISQDQPGYKFESITFWYYIGVPTIVNPSLNNDTQFQVYIETQSGEEGSVISLTKPAWAGSWQQMTMNRSEFNTDNGFTDIDWGYNDNYKISLDVHSSVTSPGNATIAVFVDDISVTETPTPIPVFSNGGFETGVLLPYWHNELWNIIGDYPYVNVTTSAKLTGNYGLRLYGDNLSWASQTYPAVGQRIPLDFEVVTIHYKIKASTGSNPRTSLYSYIVTDFGDYWAEVFDVSNPPVGGWITVNLSRAEIMALNGMTEADWGSGQSAWLTIEAFDGPFAGTPASFEVFIDDVSITATGGVPTTCTNVTDVTSNSATLCAIGGGYPKWFKYGQLPGHLSWKTPNFTSGYNYTVYGSPLIGNTLFYYSACDENGCGAEQVFQTLPLNAQPQTTLGQGLKNITNSQFDIPVIAHESIGAYFWILPQSMYTLVWGLVFLAFYLGMWIRDRDLTVPVILGLLTGAFIMYGDAGLGLGLPVEFQAMAQGLTYAALAGIVLAWMKRS